MAHQYTTMVLERLNVVNNVQPCRCLTNGIQRRSNVVMLSGKLVSFADDTRVYSCINDIEKCDQLQIDLNSVYDWAHVNNRFLNARKFNYVSFNGSMTPCGSNVYTNQNMEIISPSMDVLDLDIYMSGLSGWILRTLYTRECITMLILFKSCHALTLNG